MATATIKFNPHPQLLTGKGDIDQQTVTYLGTVTFSAATDTYATGGLAALAGFGLSSLGPYSDRTPIVIYLESLIGSGWWYLWNQNASLLKIISAAGTGTTAPTEVTNATALNATTPQIFTDSVAFEVRFPRH